MTALPGGPLCVVAGALKVEANSYARSNAELEVALAQFDLRCPERIMQRAHDHTALIADAYKLVAFLAAHEAEVRAFVADLERGVYHGLRREAA